MAPDIKLNFFYSTPDIILLCLLKGLETSAGVSNSNNPESGNQKLTEFQLSSLEIET